MDSGTQEFVAEYRDLLAQLKRNEKRDINVLSMLAEDNKQHAAAIVDAIEKHILVVRLLRASLGGRLRIGACLPLFTSRNPHPFPSLPAHHAGAWTGQAPSALRVGLDRQEREGALQVAVCTRLARGAL